MTAAVALPGKPPLTRRERARRTVERALRGGILGAAAAGIAWLLAWAIAGTVFVILLLATIAAVAYQMLRKDLSLTLWAVLAAAWAGVLIERWAVQENGGLWVAAAAWIGVIVGARRAGISKWALPLLAYPLASAGLVIAAGESLADPWGVSWLWVAAVLGPVIGVRTLLVGSRRD
jgi:hypothetical protein